MRRSVASSVLAGVLLLGAGCGSEQDEMERGLVVDREVAAPESERELEMTDSERRAEEEAEEAAESAERFDESQNQP